MNNIFMNSRTFRTPLLLYAVVASLAFGAARSVVRKLSSSVSAPELQVVTSNPNLPGDNLFRMASVGVRHR